MFTYFKAAHCCGMAKAKSNTIECYSMEDCLMDYTTWLGIHKIHHMKTGKEIEFVRVIRHPDYDQTTLKNDLCLIKEQFNFKGNPI